MVHFILLLSCIIASLLIVLFVYLYKRHKRFRLSGSRCFYCKNCIDSYLLEDIIYCNAKSEDKRFDTRIVFNCNNFKSRLDD